VERYVVSCLKGEFQEVFLKLPQKQSQPPAEAPAARLGRLPGDSNRRNSKRVRNRSRPLQRPEHRATAGSRHRRHKHRRRRRLPTWWTAPDSIVTDLEELGQAIRATESWAVFVRRGEAHDALETLLSALEAGLPYAVCPACEGNGCERCRQAGYLPEHAYLDLRRQLELEESA
jgi:hypothetical protein